MKQYALYTFALMAFLLAGCASTQTSLVRADVAFTQTTQTLTAAYDRGDISDETAVQLTPLIERGSKALDAAWFAYGQGRPDTAAGYLQTINGTLAELIRIKQEARNE